MKKINEFMAKTFLQTLNLPFWVIWVGAAFNFTLEHFITKINLWFGMIAFFIGFMLISALMLKIIYKAVTDGFILIIGDKDENN